MKFLAVAAILGLFNLATPLSLSNFFISKKYISPHQASSKAYSDLEGEEHPHHPKIADELTQILPGLKKVDPAALKTRVESIFSSTKALMITKRKFVKILLCSQ